MLRIVRQAAEEYVRHQEYPTISVNLPPDLLQQRACYISIFENPGRHIRSQFGRPLPRQSILAQEIVMNTIEAIRQSTTHAFRPIDLPYLSFTVAVLGSLERISRPEHLDPNSLGLYLRSDRESTALILPRRIGIETPEDQIATAYRESGIDPRTEAVTMYRFPVMYYED